jgi:hypothetical protein
MMKNKTLLAILIASVVLSLACGACGLAGNVIEETNGDEDSPAPPRPPADEPDEPPARPPGDAPSPGKGIKGIPMYPGASEITSATPPQVPGAATGYKDIETALYESKDKICEFYEDKMPKAGTEAAAATIVVAPAMAGPEPEEPIQVTVDRPFIFFIRDIETGAVLFVGRVVDPS